jgi:BirA family transcriptional regulator, biotin operon repressor / biotin---[acetyl-CoA-carboxylase] ligase
VEVEVAGCEDPLHEWDGVPVERLRTRWGIPRLVVCGLTGSTNDVAADLARAGAPAGTCVIAEEQTAGRGRWARSWDSPPGLGVWLSLVLRPPVGADPSLLPLLAGLAVARAVEPWSRPALPGVKWPNDILVGGGKLCGILCAADWAENRLASVIVGIGLNVLHGEDDFPPDLRGSATSLRLVSGRSPPRHEVAGRLVRALLDMPQPAMLDAATLTDLERYDALLGRTITVEEPGVEPWQGEAAGIDPDGSLRVRSAVGGLRGVRSGSVRIVGSAASERIPAAPPERITP